MFYIIQTTRFIICIIFGYSTIKKLRDIEDFKTSISNFQILPSHWNGIVAYAFIILESMISILALIGGQWLLYSYILAIILLIIFSSSLYSVLKRNIHTTCNCFGNTEETISYYDLGRNVVILFITIEGLVCFIIYNHNNVTLTIHWTIILIAFVISFIILNLREAIEFIFSYAK